MSQLTAHTCSLLRRTGLGGLEQSCPEGPGSGVPTAGSARSAAVTDGYRLHEELPRTKPPSSTSSPLGVRLGLGFS